MTRQRPSRPPSGARPGPVPPSSGDGSVPHFKDFHDAFEAHCKKCREIGPAVGCLAPCEPGIACKTSFVLGMKYEREKCAKIAELHVPVQPCRHIAEDIRARVDG